MSLCLRGLRLFAVLVMIALVRFREPFHAADFERAIIFVQSRIYLHVVSLVRSYCLGVLDAVALLVFIVLQNIVVPIFSNPSGGVRLRDAVVVGLCLLIMPVLTLVLSNGRSRAKYRES